jgi:hypothetical protein
MLDTYLRDDLLRWAMSEALWLNVGGCVRIESWVRINRVCLIKRYIFD